MPVVMRRVADRVSDRGHLLARDAPDVRRSGGKGFSRRQQAGLIVAEHDQGAFQREDATFPCLELGSELAGRTGKARRGGAGADVDPAAIGAVSGCGDHDRRSESGRGKSQARGDIGCGRVLLGGRVLGNHYLASDKIDDAVAVGVVQDPSDREWIRQMVSYRLRGLVRNRRRERKKQPENRQNSQGIPGHQHLRWVKWPLFYRRVTIQGFDREPKKRRRAVGVPGEDRVERSYHSAGASRKSGTQAKVNDGLPRPPTFGEPAFWCNRI